MGKEDLLNKGAILQRDEETYAVMAKLVGGVLDIQTARKVADAAEKYGAKTLKCTGAQRLAIIGIKEEDIDAIYKDLGGGFKPGGALCQQYVKVCPGTAFCQRGQRDTLGLAQKLEERFYPFPKLTSKLKIGVAGCYNSCTEPAIKDIGIIGLPKGWVLMVGGAGGKEPMLGQVIARNLDDERLLEILDKLLKYYRAAGQRPQTRNIRLGKIIRKEGKERIMKVCGLE